MELAHAAAILVAGVLAGTINTVIGAGTLITFPLLLALGIPPITANVSNTVGLIPAAVTGAWGYRRELRGQWSAVGRMVVLSAVGGLAGAGLLLVAPPETFTRVVPWLLVLAAGLAAAQPRVTEALLRRDALTLPVEITPSPPQPAGGEPVTRPITIGLGLAIVSTGVYGGYFGAAQGVILLALLGIWWSADLHRANGAKVVLAGVAQLVSAAVFIVSGLVDWRIAGLIAAGAALGGVLGARVGRRLPAAVLRILIIVVGLTAAALLWAGR